MSALPAIMGAAALIFLFCFVLVVIWRLCNGEHASAAQRSQMPSDYKITSRQDEIVCGSEGCFRIIDGEWVPMDRAA